MEEENRAAASDGEKAGGMSAGKIVLIVVGILVVLGIVGFIMGIFRNGAMSLGAPYFPGPAGVDVDRNMDGSVTYSTGDATVTVNGTGMPESWPEDAPEAYSGATIAYAGSTNPTTGAAGATVVYSTAASLESVVEYYEARLRALGWEIAGTANSAGLSIITATKDVRTFAAYIGHSEGLTHVTAGVELGE